MLPPAHGDGLYRGEEDKPAIFYIDARGMSGEPSVQVDGQCPLVFLGFLNIFFTLFSLWKKIPMGNVGSLSAWKASCDRVALVTQP